MNEFDDITTFIQACPTPFHLSMYLINVLKNFGFVEMKETEKWDNVPIKGYVIRDKRAVTVWNDNGHQNSAIVVTHCDSPCLILKPNYTDNIRGYNRVRCFTYGHGNWVSWFGRELRLVGKVIIMDPNGKMRTKLFDSIRGIGIIPFPANNLPSYNIENDFLVILSLNPSFSLLDYLAENLSVSSKDIIDFELRFVDSNPPTIFSGLIASQRIDNLSNTYAALKAIISSDPPKGNINVLTIFDNEEIGSSTRAGGMSGFLNSILTRIIGHQQFIILRRTSMIISCDSRLAFHPSFPTSSDAYYNFIGNGIMFDYTTDSTMTTKFLTFLRTFTLINGNQHQIHTNKNSSSIGSTVGPFCESRLDIPCTDCGIPTLALHSIRELASIDDISVCLSFLCNFYTNYQPFKIDIED